MHSQIVFTSNSSLKEQAMKKAKEQGITLKALLTFAMQAYVDGKLHVGIQQGGNASDIEELHFDDPELHESARKLALLLKNHAHTQ